MRRSRNTSPIAGAIGRRSSCRSIADRAIRARRTPIASARRCCAPMKPDVSRRHHRQPLDPVGLQQGRRGSRRLSPGLAARSGRDGGRAACRRRCRGCAPRCCAICGRSQEADGHWPQNCWLDGEPYWNGVQMDECAFPILLVDLLWREGGLTSGELRALLADGEEGRRLSSCSNGPVTGAGSLGGGCGLFAFHSGGRDRSAAGGRRYRRRRGRSRAGCLFARDRRCLERADRALDLCHRYGAGARGRRRGLLRAHRARPIPPMRARRAMALCRSRIARPIRAASRPRCWSAPTRWRWCASACARRTIRASATRCESSMRCCKVELPARTVLASLQRRRLWRA